LGSVRGAPPEARRAPAGDTRRRPPRHSKMHAAAPALDDVARSLSTAAAGRISAARAPRCPVSNRMGGACSRARGCTCDDASARAHDCARTPSRPPRGPLPGPATIEQTTYRQADRGLYKEPIEVVLRLPRRCGRHRARASRHGGARCVAHTTPPRAWFLMFPARRERAVRARGADRRGGCREAVCASGESGKKACHS
jgi:hypothetical protein